MNLQHGVWENKIEQKDRKRSISNTELKARFKNYGIRCLVTITFSTIIYSNDS